jgi:hypothetical protein
MMLVLAIRRQPAVMSQFDCGKARAAVNLARHEAAESTVMQESQDFEAYAAGASITDQGGALVTFLTDKGHLAVLKGHIAVLMRRVVLERLFEKTKSELQRVPRTGRKR